VQITISSSSQYTSVTTVTQLDDITVDSPWDEYSTDDGDEPPDDDGVETSDEGEEPPDDDGVDPRDELGDEPRDDEGEEPRDELGVDSSDDGDEEYP